MHARPSRQRPAVRSEPDALVTRAEALAAGWTDAALRHAVRTGRLVRVKRGVFAAPVRPSATPAVNDDRAVLRLAQATARGCDRAALSHAAAALAVGLPVVGPRRPCLTVPAGTDLRDLANVHLHRAGLPADHLMSVGGYATTVAARTALDVARELGVLAGVAAADAALHGRLTSLRELESVLAFCAHWPGAARARRVLALADGAAESPLESVSRVRMADFGLPAPVLQAEIGDEYGFFITRCDFYWPEFGVIGEVDGAAKYAQQWVALAEHQAQGLLADLGLQVVRWDAAASFRFATTARRLQNAFGRGTPAGQRRWSWLNDPRLRRAS